MSRCFPFPPPGYEKKPIQNDNDVLKKENLKERKHKKEKKDKEKREGKEKREKERIDGKHREKKDKKEKHKDKRKEKEKDREKGKEKGSTSEERSASGQLESCNGEKIHRRERERGKENGRTSEEKRQTGQFEGCNGEKVQQRVESKYKSGSDEKKPDVQFQRSGAKPAQNSLRDKDSEDSKFVQELGRRIRDEEKGRGSQLVEGFIGMDWKKDEGLEKFAVRDTSMVVEVKEKKKDKRVDIWKLDGQRMEHEAKFSGNAVAQNLAGSFQNKVGVPKPTEKVDGRMEGKERFKEREVDDKRGDKRKSKEKEKQSKGRDNDGEKEKEDKTKEKKKEKKESKKSEKDKTKNSNKSDLIGVLDNKTSHLVKNSDKNAPTEENLKKRKDIENGFLHDGEVRLELEKMPRLTSHLSSENGKKLEPARILTPFTPDRQGTTKNLKVDNKVHKINGLIGVQQLPISASKPSPVIAEQIADTSKPSPVIAGQIAEASRKPPHPDTKYLSKVLSVPKMDEWSGFDDQEWLFSSKNSLLKKSEVGSVGVNQEQRVWDEALQLGSADVCALPYVIPY